MTLNNRPHPARPRIVLIEDNPDNRLLVHAMIDEFCRLESYPTGAAGLSAIREEKPDLVLLDISLPEMDGTEVLRRIRSEAEIKSLPVVALTAHAMSGDREKYLEIGFDEYVTKPIVDEGILLAAIQKCLSR